MSLTIHRSPEDISLAFNPIEFELSSDEQDAIDFYYLLTVKDGAGTPIARLKIVGSADVTEHTIVDISTKLRQLQRFDSWRYDVTGSSYIYNPAGFRIPYSVDISEFYDGEIQSTESVDDLYTIPAGLHSIKFAYYDYATDLKTPGKWLTNFNSHKVRRSDKLTLTFFQPETAITDYIYKFFNAGGTLLYTVTQTNPAISHTEDAAFLHVGLQELKTFYSLSDSVTDNTAYYTITAYYTGFANTYRIDIVQGSCKFPGVRLHYLNEWGGVDSFLFKLATRRSTSIEKKKAKLPFSGTPLRPSIFGIGNTPYNVTYTDTLKITSDFISDNDSAALLELVSSPLVAIETEQNLFFPSAAGNKIVLPCEIDLTNYEIKQGATDKLFNVEFDVKISVDNSRQSL